MPITLSSSHHKQAISGSSSAEELAQALIDTSSLNLRPNLYFIGNYSGRINFFAQQSRALNLVWALIKKDFIKAGDRVAVIGGGLAGVTAAIALLQKDVQPDLFEQHTTLFRYQRNCVTRHVHPTINFWPEMPIVPSTDFPFLNWCEGSPSRIISKVQEEISKHFRDLRIHTSSQVMGVDSKDSRLFLNVDYGTSQQQQGKIEGPYSAAIVACGFGLEKRPPDLPSGVPHSYWHNDDVLPPAPPSRTTEHVFISGSGDGGLIDVIRASLDRFDNGREIIALAKLLDLPVMQRDLRKILVKERKNDSKYWNSKESLADYENLTFNKNFVSRVEKNLTDNFEITINSKSLGIFSSTSSVIHRVIVAYLIKIGRVTPIIGDLLGVDWSKESAQLRVGDRDTDGTEHVKWEGSATRVIIRHGAEGALDWLNLTAEEIGHLKMLQRLNFTNSLVPSWEPTFYDNAARFPPFLGGDYLKHYRGQAHEFFARNGCSVAIQLKNPKKPSYQYMVLCETDAAVAELPSTIFGVPIVGKTQVSRTYGTNSDNGRKRTRQHVSVRPGISVSPLVSAETAYWTLTCFAKAHGVDMGAIAPIHFWSGLEPTTRIFFNGPKGAEPSRLSAELIQAAALGRTDGQHTTDQNVGLFRIPSNIPVTYSPPGGIPWVRVASRSDIIGYLAEDVLQIGATSGRRIGVLEVCDITHCPIIGWGGGGVTYFEGLMGIRGKGKGSFSRPGDSGAVVFTQSGILLGMIIGGDPKLTLAIPLIDVISALHCEPLLDSETMRNESV
jgi:hypothetical protein